ncbi:MAG: hypothetical protein WCG83_06610 [Candidatus Peregrinibacteria bacterium]
MLNNDSEEFPHLRNLRDIANRDLNFADRCDIIQCQSQEAHRNSVEGKILTNQQRMSGALARQANGFVLSAQAAMYLAVKGEMEKADQQAEQALTFTEAYEAFFRNWSK